jgi:ribonuclease E
MKLLMPSHVRRVKAYADTVPLFQRGGVEDQLSAMYQPVVQLKSGGYLVINPTEALVSIDINSGRSTREHNIEQTAYATNIEAANEIARQLRLRDMAGLVVIDFIDMESNGHIRKVEKAMKEALKNDRARIQVGRISSFGLMEMSRQRLRTGVLEASTKPCPHCEGSGLMRTASSAGLSALRMLEDEAARGRGSRIVLRAGQEAAIYVLNKKRHEIDDIESRYGVVVEVLIDESFEGARMSVESLGPPPVQRPRVEPVAPAVDEDEDLPPEEDEIEDEEEEEEEAASEPRQERRPERPREEEGSDDRGRKRRRRRGRRGGRRREGTEGEHHPEEGGEGNQEVMTSEPMQSETPAEADGEEAQAAPEAPEQAPQADGPAAEEEQPRKARRRPRARKKVGAEAEAPASDAAAEEPPASEAVVADAPPAEATANPEEPPAKPKRTRRKKAVEPAAETASDQAAPPPAANDAAPKDARPLEAAAASVAPRPDAPEATALEREEASAEGGDDGASSSPRRGWWQRTFGA